LCQQDSADSRKTRSNFVKLVFGSLRRRWSARCDIPARLTDSASGRYANHRNGNGQAARAGAPVLRETNHSPSRVAVGCLVLSIAATRSLHPDPHCETVFMACVKAGRARVEMPDALEALLRITEPLCVLANR
jgi:hypothetical protein